MCIYKSIEVKLVLKIRRSCIAYTRLLSLFLCKLFLLLYRVVTYLLHFYSCFRVIVRCLKHVSSFTVVLATICKQVKHVAVKCHKTKNKYNNATRIPKRRGISLLPVGL